MTNLPPDQPDDIGPTIPERFRVYAEPRPAAPWGAFWTVIVVAGFLLAGCFAVVVS